MKYMQTLTAQCAQETEWYDVASNKSMLKVGTWTNKKA